MSAYLSRQNIAQCVFPPWEEDEKASCCIFLVYYLRLCIHVDEHSIGTQTEKQDCNHFLLALFAFCAPVWIAREKDSLKLFYL